jgi:hypothetical protein
LYDSRDDRVQLVFSVDNMNTNVSGRESVNGVEDLDAISRKLMSSRVQNPYERRIAAMPAGSRLTERSSIFLSRSIRPPFLLPIA